MPIFPWYDDALVSITDTVETFTELALPLVAKSDLDEVKRLYSIAYAQVLKGRKRNSLEETRARTAMEQALQDVLASPARRRRRYFEAYGESWWRNE